MPALRTAFLGTPDLALPALRRLAELTDLRLVVTQPDRRAGRGRRPHAPAEKRLAEELGVPVWQPERLADADVAEHLAVDLAVVMAYGHILHPAALEAPRLGCVNLHASLLPRWRGASPLQAAIRAGDRRSGISVMRVVHRLDAGPVYLRRGFELPEGVSLPWLHDRLAAEAAEALQDFLDRRETLEATPQDEAAVTVCRKLTHADGRLDWTAPGVELERQVRAFVPAPGCWAPAGEVELRIHAAALACETTGLAPGEVRVEHRRLYVGCGEGVLEITRLQSPGGKVLEAAAWLNGHDAPAFTQ